MIYGAESPLFFFFFFSSRRRHTRLVSDWSSDVCSSDLVCPHLRCHTDVVHEQIKLPKFHLRKSHQFFPVGALADVRLAHLRSEERRVGKECRPQREQVHLTKN